MNRPADETQPVRTHSVDVLQLLLAEHRLVDGICESRSEQLLFVDPGIRPLLHFQQHRVLLHPEPVTAAGHQHDVSRPDLASRHQLPVIVIDVDVGSVRGGR